MRTGEGINPYSGYAAQSGGSGEVQAGYKGNRLDKPGAIRALLAKTMPLSLKALQESLKGRGTDD